MSVSVSILMSVSMSTSMSMSVSVCVCVQLSELSLPLPAFLQSYTTAVDMWSVGCIFAELLQRKVMFPGDDYMDMLRLIIECVGALRDSPDQGAARCSCRVAYCVVR